MLAPGHAPRKPAAVPRCRLCSMKFILQSPLHSQIPGSGAGSQELVWVKSHLLSPLLTYVVHWIPVAGPMSRELAVTTHCIRVRSMGWQPASRKRDQHKRALCHTSSSLLDPLLGSWLRCGLCSELYAAEPAACNSVTAKIFNGYMVGTLLTVFYITNYNPLHPPCSEMNSLSLIRKRFVPFLMVPKILVVFGQSMHIEQMFPQHYTQWLQDLSGMVPESFRSHHFVCMAGIFCIY